MSQYSNKNFSWMRGFNPITKHSTPKTPEEENMYKKYVEKQQTISTSFKNISKKLKERNENPALRSLLLSAMSEINPKTRNDKLKVYFNMIKKLNNSKKNLNNSNNSNSNNSNSNRSNSNKSNKSAKRHKSNPKNL